MWRNIFNPQNRWIAGVSAFLMLLANGSFTSRLMQAYPLFDGNVLFVASVFLLFTLATTLLLVWLCHGRAAPWVLAFYLIASSMAAYFMSTYGTVIDQTMLENTLQTNAAEAGDLFSISMLLYLLVLGVLPAWYVLRRMPRAKGLATELRAKALFSVCLLAGMVLLIVPFTSQYASFFREHKSLRFYANPTYFTYSAIRLASSKIKGSAGPVVVQAVAPDAALNDEPPLHPKELIVLVVGETARADRFALNGYTKPTNPMLDKEDVVSLGNVTSCGTSTAVSVPCMFSLAGHDGFDGDKVNQFENVLDVLKRQGVEILWRDNNSDSKGVALRLPYENFRDPAINPVCDSECRDAGMLVGLEDHIRKHPGKDLLIVLHQMGNHGPAYYKRYPPEFERFTPVCKTNELSKCTDEEINNAYDNAISYTDHFLAQTIALLKKFDSSHETAMLYVSDHGESLGEQGMYLHGAPYVFSPREQTHVASVLWFGKNFDYRTDDLRLVKDYPFTHDDLFCALMLTFEVESGVCTQRTNALKAHFEQQGQTR
ncbi:MULTISPECIES: phosphoethanolamine transferase [Limnobacter]|jgi:lipid A ethanolaminephosphotransferase|uniref:Phosphoethanolamine--lipid A transferase n=1 Tax=Limnobacter profundi TaxID=2732163 RepID=A0ABX6N1Q8_9BURK|nr:MULTISPECIES: phosphoethanolamine--lipid A transferase [unclassified Limnobacter]MAG79708.1 phosphoethanolamine transferase [Sutterellaceae bacterium]MBA4315679.1 phosphoethanolamine transferase [Alcaligenaceae bacterium]HAV74423.1 phosphoethanolamine transferase [Limnobacter sp.]MBT85604.1 phosphoethanolamine transferase [Sutterellaceae bacterium]QJR28306.1 phosphoethanolamine--lipid A transferase [Limnobacter sp. SAORIC-580]|tara:strand:+ start:2842 stop:4467 length:1626 start_codon:yes stop_codon:yes gene_type:complete